MSSTQERLEEILDRLAVRMYDEGQLDKPSVMGRQVAIVNINEAKNQLTQLIDSAKREGAIEELKKLPSNRHESSGYCNAEFFIDSEDRWKRIKELEQSEESK